MTFHFVSISIVLFAYGWRKSAHDTSIEPRVVSGICFGAVVLSCLILSRGKRFSDLILYIVKDE